MDEESTLLHDHSTFDGRLSLFLHRLKWKHLILPAVLLAACAGVAILIAALDSELKDNSPSNASNIVQLAPAHSLLGEDAPVALDNSVDVSEIEENHGWTVVKQPKPGFIEAEGCENGLYSFEGFDSSVDVSSAKSLRIRYLVLDAPSLSKSLAEWTSLESIVIENVWVNGNFSRVYLPSLKKFIYHQYRNGKTDQYKQQDMLKQILFFDTHPTQSWDLNKDLLNLNVTVQVTVEGTKILNIEPDDGEININTHECQDMLENFHPEQTYNLTTLSLSWCSLGAPFLTKIQESKSSLKYLFLNNAVPGSTAELAQVTSSLRNLRELHIFQRFHCEWPGYEIYLNVSDLASSLDTLSVTNLDISFTPGVGAPSVRNLSLDQYVGKDVVDNFETIFPNLETVALFNITQNLSYPLLQKVVQRVKPKLIIVTDFKRENHIEKNGEKEDSNKLRKKPNQIMDDSNSVAANGIIADIERLLRNSGVPDSATCFSLELSDSEPLYVGKELTSFQKNFHRFIRLAFKKIDTYADYVTWDADQK